MKHSGTISLADKFAYRIECCLPDVSMARLKVLILGRPQIDYHTMHRPGFPVKRQELMSVVLYSPLEQLAISFTGYPSIRSLPLKWCCIVAVVLQGRKSLTVIQDSTLFLESRIYTTVWLPLISSFAYVCPQLNAQYVFSRRQWDKT